jgi:hypothetical protein
MTPKEIRRNSEPQIIQAGRNPQRTPMAMKGWSTPVIVSILLGAALHLATVTVLAVLTISTSSSDADSIATKWFGAGPNRVAAEVYDFLVIPGRVLSDRIHPLAICGVSELIWGCMLAGVFWIVIPIGLRRRLVAGRKIDEPQQRA